MARVRSTPEPTESTRSKPDRASTAMAPRPRGAPTGGASKRRAAPAGPRGDGPAMQVACIGAIAGCLYASLALATYSAGDPSLSVASGAVVRNLGGPLGAVVADGLYQAFGYSAWAVVVIGLFSALRLAGRQSAGPLAWALGGVGHVLVAAALTLSLGPDADPFPAGGALGGAVAGFLSRHVGPWGAGIGVVTGLLGIATILFRIDWQPLAARAVDGVRAGAPAAMRGLGAAGAGVAAGVRARVDALRRPAEEDDDDAADVDAPSATGAPAAEAPEPTATRRAPDVPAERRAPELPAVVEKPRDRVTRAPRERAPERDTGLVLPSVWSARAAPTPIPTPIGSPDELDEPTRPAGRTLVEVEWEPTSYPRAAERAAGRPPPPPPEGYDPVRPLNPPSVLDDELDVIDDVRVAVGGAPSWPASDRPTRARSDGPMIRGPEVPARSEPRIPEPPSTIGRLTVTPRPAPPPVVVPASAPPAPQPAAAAPADDPPVESPPAPSAAEPADAWSELDPDDAASEPAAPAPPQERTRVRRASGPAVVVGDLRSGGATDDGKAVRNARSFQLPPLSLLDDHPAIVATTDEAALTEVARRLVQTLKEFKIEGRVSAIRPGPVITMYEYEPAAGVKLSSITGLQDNIKMALRAVSVRIVAPLPGKGCVGIEVPNERRQTIWARDVFAASEFTTVERILPMILGKDTEGRPVVVDLAKMPHLMIGGTTGAGKSVGVNAMLCSMLYMRTPEELRMILIDPKMLEFALYNDIPHLLHPVVTDAKFASAVLQWACNEMDDRYRTMARWQTRNLESYNDKVRRELKDWTPEKARYYAPKDWPEGDLLPQPRTFPYIVVVIDELAELMQVASGDVEASISRLAAKARASGIHLILATQSPRRDVLTGVIKANMPASVAYQVRGPLDSRIILDEMGAETLLGKGDLLYRGPGTSNLTRIHGPFLTETEVQRVADHLRAQGAPEYDTRIASAAAGAGAGDEEEVEYDALYDEAIEFAVAQGKISTSSLQRHLGVGYNRAANIIDTMEREGVVGPADGVKPRKILVSQ